MIAPTKTGVKGAPSSSHSLCASVCRGIRSASPFPSPPHYSKADVPKSGHPLLFLLFFIPLVTLFSLARHGGKQFSRPPILICTFQTQFCLTGKIRLVSAHKAYNESMITLNDIHLRLCECIRESGCTQTHLAELLGISPATISHYLRGDKFPALDTLANLCRILDVSPAYILCFE